MLPEEHDLDDRVVLSGRFDLDAAGGRVAIGFGDHLYLSEDRGETWQVAAVLPGAVTAVRFSPD